MTGSKDERGTATWFEPGRRELPYADEPVESGMNEWAWLRTARGKTPSESKLLQVVRGSVLSLWSIPGPFNNDGLIRNGGGGELCDLLVVFGEDVIVFSDKECAFSEAEEINVAWRRWYTRAIKKSARQLVGAAKALSRPGTRLFADAACKTPLPLKLPAVASMRIHLIAVAHGAIRAAKRHWARYGGSPGSSGSLMLNTELVGDDHLREPFHVGWPADRGHFVHVFDTLTLDLLLHCF